MIRGTSANVLVEGNKIMDSDVGIHVNCKRRKERSDELIRYINNTASKWYLIYAFANLSWLRSSAYPPLIADTTTKGGIVVVGNEEPEGVPENYNPYSEEEERVTHVKV